MAEIHEKIDGKNRGRNEKRKSWKHIKVKDKKRTGLIGKELEMTRERQREREREKYNEQNKRLDT